jgi:hypothetical protein
MSELAAIIVACTGLSGALGAVGKFVWNKIEARFTRIEAQLKACERREKSANSRSAAHVVVIELLWRETSRLSAEDNPVLRRAKRLLDQLAAELPVTTDLPEDMAALVAALDEE